MRLRVGQSAVLAITIIMLVRWALGGFDFSYFIVAGEQHVTTAEITTVDGSGYDGQYFYRFALAPLQFENEVHGVVVDNPAYRHQRITYPALVWMLSMGNSELIPFMLVLVNLLAFAGILLLLSRWVHQLSSNKWLVLMPLLFAGYLFAMSRDLSEVVTDFFVLASIYSFYRSRYFLFGLTALLAVLSRETMLLFYGVLAANLFVRILTRKWEPSSKLPLLVSVFPIAGGLLWRTFVFSKYDLPLLGTGSENFNVVPFYGIIQGFSFNVPEQFSIKEMAELSFWTMYFVWLLLLIWLTIKDNFKVHLTENRVIGDWLRFSFVLWVLMSVFYSFKIWEDDWSFMRVNHGLFLTALLIMIVNRKEYPRYFMYYSVLTFALTLSRIWIFP